MMIVGAVQDAIDQVYVTASARVFEVLMRTAGIVAGEVLANAAGALLAATLTTLVVRRIRVPGFGLISAALLPLVPGLSLYQGLLTLVGTSAGTADPAAGGSTLFLALGSRWASRTRTL